MDEAAWKQEQKSQRNATDHTVSSTGSIPATIESRNLAERLTATAKNNAKKATHR